MALCPMCGDDDVPQEEIETIEKDMEFEARSCLHCGRCFWEVREELDL